MKKAQSLILLASIIIISLSGCSLKKSTAVVYDEAVLQQTTDMLIQILANANEEDLSQYLNKSELEVNLALMQMQIPADKESFSSMITAWQAAVEECGVYEKHEALIVTSVNDEITVSTKGIFNKRDADIEILFDKQSNITAMTINGKYTTPEILKKAGINTLLGMGTVFTVLIFISFIISLFSYIPAIQSRLSGRKKDIVAPSLVEETIVDDQMQCDDLELVAVIAASIAKYTGTTTDDFIVRKIKRRTENKWNERQEK